MKDFVLDASVALAWCLEDERDARALAVLDLLEQHQAAVPSIWPYEVANSLLVAERRKRLEKNTTAYLAGTIRSLPIYVDEDSTGAAMMQTFLLADLSGNSVYDAAYLELALRRNLPLATLDRRLSEKAAALEIALLIQAK